MTIAPVRLRARTRLTLWYVSLLAATVVALGSLGLWATGRALYGHADELLRSRAGAVQTEVEFERGRLTVDLRSEPSAQAASVTAGLDLVRVWDPNPGLIYEQATLPGLPPAEPSTLTAILAGQRGDEYNTVRTADGANVRVYSEPVRYRGRIVGVVQVGRSEADIEGILSQLRLAGGGGLLVALALAWVGGYFLAGRALAPVDQITRAATRIGADDLSQRLAVQFVDDELGRLAAAFDGMIDRLEQAFQRQRRFTSDAAHELRTPLAIIRSQVDVGLSRPREPAYYARVLTSVREESERLGRLTESLLLLARADTGQPLAFAEVDIEELVAEVGARFAPRARERAIQLEVMLGHTNAVRGDATWLTQLLLNLLDNALRHTPPGGRVTLTLEPVPGGALLKVADSGDGISPEHLPHLFERFYRADQARTGLAGGAGLGLAICDWVARAHGGRLEVESAVGKGTVFSLRLPESASRDSTAYPEQPEPVSGRPAPVTTGLGQAVETEAGRS